MFRYRNEAMFSRALCEHLRGKGWFIQRIESHETGKGIPDIYAIAPEGVAVWLELKRAHKKCPKEEDRIQWRPGQQAWLHTVTRRKQRAFTVCCYDDYLAIIKHDRLYKDCIVNRTEMRLVPSLSNL